MRKGWPRQLRQASSPKQNKKESFLSAASRSSSSSEDLPNGPFIWIIGTIATMTAPSEGTSAIRFSADRQVRERMNREHEKAIGQIGIQRNGRCLRSTDGASDISWATRAGIPVHRRVLSSLDSNVSMTGLFIHLLPR